jgi:tetratricopeptide (TPR) repeat protein
LLSAVTDAELAHRVLALWDYRDPAGSQARFAAAADAEADPVRRAVLRTQQARAQGLRDDFAGGHATLDALGEPATLTAEPAVRVLLERGRLRNSGGDPAGSAPLFEQAYHRAVAEGLSGLAADAAHMLAIVLPPERHEEWAERGLRLADGSADPLARSMAGALLNNLGWTHADAGRWEQAYRLFDRAVTAREQAWTAVPVAATTWSLHLARWTRARALRALGRHDEAAAELRELAKTPQGAADPHVAEEIAANEAATRDPGTP